jgi:hypothetical protein
MSKSNVKYDQMFPSRALDVILPLNKPALWITRGGLSLYQTHCGDGMKLPEDTNLAEMLNSVPLSVLLDYQQLVCHALLYAISLTD